MGHTHQAEVCVGVGLSFFYGKEKSKNLTEESVGFGVEISGLSLEGSVGAFLEMAAGLGDHDFSVRICQFGNSHS